MTTEVSPLRRPVAEQLAVGQAGERVVERLVLLRDRLATAAVDGEDRQEEQHDRRQREVRGQHDDRGQAEHEPVDRRLEEQVAGHVLEDADALGERDHGRDQAGVEDEERHRGEQHARQVARDEMRLGEAREIGRGLEHPARGADRDRVLEEVERDLLQRLAGQRVRDQVREPEGEERGQRAGHQHGGDGEGGRGGDLALGAAREDLQREELAAEGKEEEHPRFRGEEQTQLARAT
jgi:hypothetical protein